MRYTTIISAIVSFTREKIITNFLLQRGGSFQTFLSFAETSGIYLEWKNYLTLDLTISSNN